MDIWGFKNVLLTLEQLLVPLRTLCLASIVTFPTEFQSRVVNGFVQVEALGEQLRGREQDAEIV